MTGVRPTGLAVATIKTIDFVVRHAFSKIVVSLLLSVFAVALGASQANAQTPTLNSKILEAIKLVETTRSNGGYDLNKAYTQNLSYGQGGVIPTSSRPAGATPPHSTMCVAAVVEVLVEAINLHAAEPGANKDIYQLLALKSWRSGNILSLKANIFRFQGTGSPGTAFSLERMGIGRQKPFESLVPGDVVNFNRPPSTTFPSGSGHSVFFISFLTKSSEVSSYSDQVVGFRYFSAQGGSRPDAGFGYRNGYFMGSCPQPRKAGVDDCNIFRGLTAGPNGTRVQDQFLLNTGEMYHPSAWSKEKLDSAQAAITRSVERGFSQQGLSGNALRSAVATELQRELDPRPELYVDGTEG